MPRPPAPLPSSFRWRAFTRDEALEAGIPAGRLRRADLERPRRNLYLRSAEELMEADIAAAFCRSDPGSVVTGLSAARIYRMPLPQHLEKWTRKTVVHLAVPGGRRGSDEVVRWHAMVLGPGDTRRVTLPRLPATQHEDELTLFLRLTTRSRTWRDLGGHLSHVQRVAVGDYLVRRPRPDLERGRSAPWCTLEELRSQCTGRHASALRRALVDVRIGADSPRETMLRLAFLRAGLPEPQINVPILGDDGKTRHSPDFQWPEYRVAAEYDGAVHSSPDQVARDIARARRVRDAGWTEVRLHSPDARDAGEGAVRLMRRELRAKGWKG